MVTTGVPGGEVSLPPQLPRISGAAQSMARNARGKRVRRERTTDIRTSLRVLAGRRSGGAVVLEAAAGNTFPRLQRLRPQGRPLEKGGSVPVSDRLQLTVSEIEAEALPRRSTTDG